jgi:D-alanine-D-alanine ligase
MKLTVTYSSKEGLLREYGKRFFSGSIEGEVPADFFAEGDSAETIGAVIEALRQGGHEVTGLEADDQVMPRLMENRPDLVFNIAEGLFGDCRESMIPMLCEQAGIAYSGSDPLTLGICLNKARAKEILSYYRIPNPAFRVFSDVKVVETESFDYPAIVKPVAEGSSKGIFEDSVVDNEWQAKDRIVAKLEKYMQPIVMESFLPGTEYTVAMWGNGGEWEVLPIVEFNYGNLPAESRRIYSYEAKWIWDTPDKPLEIFQCPARLNGTQKEQIEAVVKQTVRVLGIRDWCRIDIREDGFGRPNVLEVNPLPGILPNPEDNSCFPKAARTAGYNYAAMLNKVVTIAARRQGIR